MVRDSGSPRIDAESDFLRARRHQVLSSLAARVRGDEDVTTALSFDEVVDALGRRGEQRIGNHAIRLDAIVGSVDRVRDFDRRFRPTSSKSRQRWERLARANRTGESIPPIEVYKLGEYYFVQDGHHRVSVARAMGLTHIDANVTEVHTFLTPVDIGRRVDLDTKHWRRAFLQRVPLPMTAREVISVKDPVDYGRLAEMVEAWSARLMHRERVYLDPASVALRWFLEEYGPVNDMIVDAGIRGPDETPAEVYMRVAGERYRLIREHEWNREVMQQIRSAQRKRSTRTKPK